MKKSLSRKRVCYTKTQVLSYLTDQYPEVDWATEVGGDLPNLVWRHRWRDLADRLELPFSRNHLSNDDSRGVGPASYPAR